MCHAALPGDSSFTKVPEGGCQHMTWPPIAGGKVLLGPLQGSLTQYVPTHIPSCAQSPGHKPAGLLLLCCTSSPLELRAAAPALYVSMARP